MCDFIVSIVGGVGPSAPHVGCGIRSGISGMWCRCGMCERTVRACYTTRPWTETARPRAEHHSRQSVHTVSVYGVTVDGRATTLDGGPRPTSDIAYET